jgi:hypothetical protein
MSGTPGLHAAFPLRVWAAISLCSNWLTVQILGSVLGNHHDFSPTSLEEQLSIFLLVIQALNFI